jgi:hypothetical protein
MPKQARATTATHQKHIKPKSAPWRIASQAVIDAAHRAFVHSLFAPATRCDMQRSSEFDGREQFSEEQNGVADGTKP